MITLVLGLTERHMVAIVISTVFISNICFANPDNTINDIRGFVIWESNRSGNWELYRANIDGTGFKQISQLSTIYPLPYDKYLIPRISPDGEMVLFTYGRQGGPAEVWVIPSSGGEAKKLTVGRPLNWSTDGKFIYFIRDSKVWQYEVATGKESILYDINLPVDGRDGNTVGDISPNLDSVVLRSEKSNEYFVFAQGKTVKTMGGCEPSFSPEGRYVYWVQGPKDFRAWDIQNDSEFQLLGTPEYENWNYTYFPRISRDGKWLVYGASPNQHDHNTSDYEIFVIKLEGMHAIGKPIRISQHPATDRWGDIFVHHDNTPPDAPSNFKAQVIGQGVRLSWDASKDPESKITHYNIYRGTVGMEQKLLTKVTGLSYVDTGLDADTKYHYSISAVNFAELESPRSKTVTIVTKDSRPSNPSNVSVVNSGNRRALVSWDANQELDIKGYNVYRSLHHNKGFTKLNKKLIQDTSYIDDFVEHGKTYYYYVTAVDRAGQESKSSEVVSKKITERVTDGLLALYVFNGTRSPIIRDVSGIEPLLDLKVSDEEKVTWDKKENAIEIKSNTMIVSQGNADKLFNNIKNKGQLSIEVWFCPSSLSQTGPARIVTMSTDPLNRDFTIGQIGTNIAFRLRTTRTDQNGIPELDTQSDVLSQKPIHLVATYDGSVKRLYIDGQLCSETQHLDGDFSNWSNYPLVIGNELTGDRPWLGKIYLVGIYSRSLDPSEILKNYQAGFN